MVVNLPTTGTIRRRARLSNHLHPSKNLKLSLSIADCRRYGAEADLGQRSTEQLQRRAELCRAGWRPQLAVERCRLQSGLSELHLPASAAELWIAGSAGQYDHRGEELHHRIDHQLSVSGGALADRGRQAALPGVRGMERTATDLQV